MVVRIVLAEKFCATYTLFEAGSRRVVSEWRDSWQPQTANVSTSYSCCIEDNFSEDSNTTVSPCWKVPPPSSETAFDFGIYWCVGNLQLHNPEELNRPPSSPAYQTNWEAISLVYDLLTENGLDVSSTRKMANLKSCLPANRHRIFGVQSSRLIPTKIPMSIRISRKREEELFLLVCESGWLPVNGVKECESSTCASGL